ARRAGVDQAWRDRCDQDAASQVLGAPEICQYANSRNLSDLGGNVDPGRPRSARRAPAPNFVSPHANRAVDVIECLEILEMRVQHRRQRAEATRPAGDYEQPSAITEQWRE